MERFLCADIRSQHWPERFGLELIGSQKHLAARDRLQLVATDQNDPFAEDHCTFLHDKAHSDQRIIISKSHRASAHGRAA